jgi:DNA repair protein RecO (recombination protein O)
MDYKYTSIILSKKNVAETDRIYTVYTREAGKIRILGKGVRKSNAKLAGSLEPVTLSEIFVAKSRGLGKITGAIASDNFLHIKSSFEALKKVSYVFGIFSKIISEAEKDERIFDILSGFLKALDKISAKEEAREKMDIVVLGFVFKMLGEMGYGIEVEKCVHCGGRLKPENNFFSPGKGGVLCLNCHQLENKRVKISPEAIKLIRIFLKNKIENLAKLKVASKDISNLKIIAQEAINWL